MLGIEDLPQTSANLITVWRTCHNFEASPSVPCRQTKSGIYIMKLVRPSILFDWHHEIARKQLRAHEIRHMAIDRQPWGKETRVIGIPLDKDLNRPTVDFISLMPYEDKGKIRYWRMKEPGPMPAVDIQMVVDAKDIDPDSHRGQVSIIPAVDVRRKQGDELRIRFAYPDNIEEQIADVYIPPYPRASSTQPGSFPNAT